jgi:hypothetical protein
LKCSLSFVSLTLIHGVTQRKLLINHVTQKEANSLITALIFTIAFLLFPLIWTYYFLHIIYNIRCSLNTWVCCFHFHSVQNIYIFFLCNFLWPLCQTFKNISRNLFVNDIYNNVIVFRDCTLDGLKLFNLLLIVLLLPNIWSILVTIQYKFQN